MSDRCENCLGYTHFRKYKVYFCIISDRWSLGFEEYDMTLPVRLYHDSGKPVDHGFHFLPKTSLGNSDIHSVPHGRRRKRQTNDDDTFNINRPLVANYSVAAFGETFSFHLVPYADFISPTFTTDYRGEMSVGVEQTLEDTPRHCFYSGHVDVEPDHKVVVSLCGGLVSA